MCVFFRFRCRCRPLFVYLPCIFNIFSRMVHLVRPLAWRLRRRAAAAAPSSDGAAAVTPPPSSPDAASSTAADAADLNEISPKKSTKKSKKS